MTTSYKELLQQREALEQAIANARAHELSEAVRRTRELVAEFGLTVQDVFPSGRGNSKPSGKATTGAKVAPKYRDPATGQTWTGRGKAPKWIDGQDRSKYLIA
jgi:DNA-binding protein H-NS